MATIAALDLPSTNRAGASPNERGAEPISSKVGVALTFAHRELVTYQQGLSSQNTKTVGYPV